MLEGYHLLGNGEQAQLLWRCLATVARFGRYSDRKPQSYFPQPWMPLLHSPKQIPSIAILSGRYISRDSGFSGGNEIHPGTSMVTARYYSFRLTIAPCLRHNPCLFRMDPGHRRHPMGSLFAFVLVGGKAQILVLGYG